MVIPGNQPEATDELSDRIPNAADADGDNEELYEFFPDHSVESLCNLFERMGGGREGDSAPKALITVTQLAQSQSAKLSAKGLFSAAMGMLRAEFRLGMLPILDVLMREIAEREVYIKAHGHLEPPGRNDHKWLCLAHLCEVAAACANARYHPGEELLQSVCTAALPHASHLSTESLVQTAWSMARLGYEAAVPLIRSLMLRASSTVEQLTPKDRAQLFWAAVVLDVVTPSLLEDLGHLLEGLQSQDFGSDWQARLFQAHMALERDGRYRQAWQQKGILALLPGELLAQAEAAWRCALADTAETQAQQEASAALTELGLSHAAAVVTEGGLLKPDVIVMTPSGRVALTLEQPSAFSINTPYRPLGDAILNRRLLELNGWKVVSIPFYQWQNLGTLEARVAHLRELLLPASAGPPPRAPVSDRSASATVTREALRGMQSGGAAEALRSDPGLPAARQRSLSSTNLGLLGAASPGGEAPTTWGHSAPPLAGGTLGRQWSLDNAALRQTHPPTLVSQLLAAQQGPNPFSRQAGAAEQQLLQQQENVRAGHLSDPGGLRPSQAAAQLPSSFLPRPPSMHPTYSAGGGSSNPSDVSTMLTTLSSEGSRTAPPPWHARHASDTLTTTSGESARTTKPLPWSAGDAGGFGSGGSGGAAGDFGRAAEGVVAHLRRGDSGISQGALQQAAAGSDVLPEGRNLTVPELAARLAALSRGEGPGVAHSVAVSMSISQPSDTQYPEMSPHPAEAAAALRLPQAGMHPPLHGVPPGLEEQLLATGVYVGVGDPHALMRAPPPIISPAGGPGAMPLSAQQHAALSQILTPGSRGTSLGSLGPHDSATDLRQLWQAVAGLDPGQPPSQLPQEAANPAELKRIIEGLPLETSAVAAVEWRLGQLDPPQFAALLTELARDNHAFRAWQLFDWVRALPEGHALRRLCDADTYTTMITLCGPWQQLRRALQLVAEMRARSLECGAQAYSALLHAAVKCGETDLAVDIYGQMGREGMPRDRSIFVALIEMFVKLGRVPDALSALADLHALGEPPDTHLYNLVLVAATKMGPPRFALTVYHRMVTDGAQPNTKTFTALIGSFGKPGSVAAELEVIEQLLSHEPGGVGSAATYAALMAACEKAGQGDLALALFEKMAAQNVRADVGIFNSMIAACAHGGEYAKARHMFASMAEAGCEPDAVTYANLIRAFKKGGQWCAAVDTFEAMLRSGSRPHAAVYSSIIDVLWQTGIPWAQAKALHLFNSAVQNGSLPAAAESCKKGTLKLDLQSLTVGVAVVSMGAWLLSARAALLQDTPTSLDAARKLAVVNGLGEHSRAQGHSAAVKEAVSASLLGCKAPFRLVQDHSRSGRLEASTLALRKWLFSDQFDRYLSLVQAGPAEIAPEALQPTAEYMAHEEAEKARTADLWGRVVDYEAMHPISLKVLHANSGAYLQQRKGLVAAVVHYASALRVPQEVAHSAVTLMDRVMMSGVHMTDQFQTLFICSCLRLAALHENAALPSGLAVSSLTDFPETALERMESNISAVLRNDMECIAAVHCLKVYCQRLGCDLADGDAVRRAVGCAFALATEALADMAVLQFPPSLTAAAILVAARRAQGSVPFWPSVLAQLTGYTEASSPPFASAIAHAGRLCSKLYTSVDPAMAAYHP